MGTNNRNFKDVVIRDIALDDPKTPIFLNCSYWAVHWAQLTGSGCVFGCNFPKGSKLHRRDGSCGTGGKKI